MREREIVRGRWGEGRRRESSVQKKGERTGDEWSSRRRRWSSRMRRSGGGGGEGVMRVCYATEEMLEVWRVLRETGRQKDR